MIDYVDPIPSVLEFMNNGFNGNLAFYGNTFPADVEYPAVLVKSVGGSDYYRIQFLSRANSDIEAMAHLIEVMNYFERYGQDMRGIRVLWVERESTPTTDVDEDTGIPEAWAYMSMEALEA